ncbi:hypothetical protein ASF29_12465 [Rhizobium sp. Leaf262]|nr:hypothetical protein ASF29_12465 [Rhizobium sp. Leaf262]
MSFSIKAKKAARAEKMRLTAMDPPFIRQLAEANCQGRNAHRLYFLQSPVGVLMTLIDILGRTTQE